MLLFSGLVIVEGYPERVVRVPTLIGGEFDWVCPSMDSSGPGKPAVSVLTLNTVSMLGAANGEYV